MSSIEFNFPKAQRRLEEAQEQLEAQKEALRRAQQIVHDREVELMQAAVKDGVVATTATAATVALNPATAAKVGAASVGVAKTTTIAALGWKQHLLAGGIARGVAVSTLFPVDSIKTKLQIGQKISWRLDSIGVEHFSGFRAAILGQIPYGMLVFGTYETIKAMVFARYPDAPKLAVFIGAAVVGDSAGAIWLTPSEIVKQRLQSGQAKDTLSVVRSIYTQKGLRGFYAGFSGMLARDLPFRALQLPLYEVSREAYSTRFCAPKGKMIAPHEAMLVGASVGMLAAGITTPLDVVKSRMMVGASAGQSVPQVVKQILKEGGVKGLFSGAPQRVGYLGLSNAIFFIMYEFVRGLMAGETPMPMTSA
mmetsp:Transcript_5793/g.13455  ORF Transcript_5793/g.13455 Transcript_5793/m.13455 type:complete len:364 (-) Transcript_5793:2284-3375(-)